jgi:Arc/MetJ family transcription regulator
MMRTNIVIDDALMREAMKATGLKTKRAVVEAGLRKLVQLKDQARALEELRGTGWDGDLDEMRGKRRR